VTIDTGSLNTSISTKLSGGNSTVVPLLSGFVFNGAWEVTANFTTLVCSLKTDQGGILYLEFSPDGVNVDASVQYIIEPDVHESHRIVITQKYFRARVFNVSLSAQTYIRMQVTYGNHPLQMVPLNGTVQPDSDALLTKSVLYADDGSGGVAPVSMTAGDLNVTGSFAPSGLRVRMKISNIVVNDVASIIPALPLASRNSIILENKGLNSIFLGESNVTASGINEGWEVAPTAFFSTDVTDAIAIYAIAPVGTTVNVKIMELA
jgi:hypothetical protein